ncbi:unnamed protein product [Urochloa humidicola]
MGDFTTWADGVNRISEGIDRVSEGLMEASDLCRDILGLLEKMGPTVDKMASPTPSSSPPAAPPTTLVTTSAAMTFSALSVPPLPSTPSSLEEEMVPLAATMPPAAPTPPLVLPALTPSPSTTTATPAATAPSPPMFVAQSAPPTSSTLKSPLKPPLPTPAPSSPPMTLLPLPPPLKALAPPVSPPTQSPILWLGVPFPGGFTSGCYQLGHIVSWSGSVWICNDDFWFGPLGFLLLLYMAAPIPWSAWTLLPVPVPAPNYINILRIQLDYKDYISEHSSRTSCLEGGV